MPVNEPVSELEPHYSSPNATQTEWPEARQQLEQAEVYWLTTVRPDGRPHVTPLVATWLDGALYFCTGPAERKAKNLAHNAHCAITTGCNVLEGLDVVIEGDARQVSDKATLQRVSERLSAKYGPPFQLTVGDGAFVNSEGGRALVYEVAPATIFGFGKGDAFSQTRWRF
jgi:general stress protein 26